MLISRRTFVVGSAAAAALSQVGCAATGIAVDSAGDKNTFRTALCDLLGIEYPIIQSGMGTVAGAQLAAAVSSAGGLGVLAGLNLTADELRRQIREVRALTDRPFGVNLWLHSELRPPADVASIPENTVRAVQSVLNRFRERLGLAETFARPSKSPDLFDAAFEVILEERVPVWSAAMGNPTAEMVERCHQRGIKVISMVATVEDARAVAAAGVDAVVAQGGEAGGHRSTGVKARSREAATIGTLALVPQVVDAVKVPVIAAGGIADGRGLVAAVALGASGVLLGTRFVATRESQAAAFYKRAVIERGSDSTAITDAFTGLYARVFRNTFTEEYAASGAPVLPTLVQARAARDIFTKATAQGNPEYAPMWAGQSCGLIHDLPGAADVVRAIVREGRAAMPALAQRIKQV